MRIPTYALSLLLIVIILGVQGTCRPIVEPCLAGGNCPPAPQNSLSRGIIIELENFYTLDDLTGRLDSFEVCYAEGRRESYRSKGEGCGTVYYTGEEIFLRNLNNILVGVGKTQRITDVKTLRFDTCKCAAEIFLLTLPNHLLYDLDINNKVASGTSQTREESNGMFAAIGFNHDLSNTMAFYEPQLAPVRGSGPDSCGIVVDAEGYKPTATDSLSGLNPADLQKQIKTLATRQFTRWQCSKPPVLKIADAISNPRTVTVAVIDSGSDPFYNYLPEPGQNVDLARSFRFTSEINVLGSHVLDLSFGDGDPIAGDGVDANGNCLPDDYFGYDYFGGDNNPSDKNGHGTHISGTILTANLVANHPVRIMPLQFGDQDETGKFSASLFAAICALNYASRQGADVINMSWGYTSTDTSKILLHQLEKARRAGALMVASVGNDTLNVDGCFHWPSHFSTFDNLGEQLISVAALDVFTDTTNLRLAPFSNFGHSIDIAAPGTGIRSALVHSVDGNIALNGTSMAAAVISRRAAILLHDPDEPRTAAQVKELILSQAISRPWVCIDGGRLYNPIPDQDLLPAIGY